MKEIIEQTAANLLIFSVFTKTLTELIIEQKA